jgi:HlyD family secretion protein
MRRAIRFVLAVILLAAAAAGALRYLERGQEKPVAFQGYMEGYLVYMGPEEGGRIERLTVEAGDPVSEGQLLFTLESSVQVAQRNEVEARLRQAEAQLSNLKAALQRPEQIAILRAQVARARAQLELSKNEFDRQQTLFQKGITAKAQLDQARTAFERDQAALEEAQRQIDAAQLAGRSAEIAAAEAAVRASEAMLRQSETRVAKRRVSAPADARVQDVFFRPGEVVNAGQPVLSLLPPGNVRVRFYVPEPLLSTMSLGQTVALRCDRCPSDLRARIVFLSREAEYTPPVIFSDKERAKLVFRAEAKPIGTVELPIGLPVSVTPLDLPATASTQP